MLSTFNQLLSTFSSKTVTVRLAASLQGFPFFGFWHGFEARNTSITAICERYAAPVPRSSFSLSLRIDSHENTLLCHLGLGLRFTC